MEPETQPTDKQEPPPSALLSSDNDSSDSDSGEATSTTTSQVEWLATTREKRSTAGNRMKSMLASAEADDDLELLFAEDENDQGFSDLDDDASDMHMDSSSDDDDDNNNANAADDLEGEKELEKQAKERRAAQRKRKAQEAIPAKFRKKVRIDPTTPTAPAPRPKKKSERASWLPSPADLPTRASSRSTTRMSKESLHQQMVEREAKRLKQLAQMQRKAAILEASKKPPMTQEERLKEAATVEKRNSKSLNRWEEAEKLREEERKAKLAALHQRTLKGPVLTFWSGIGEWADDKLKLVGRHIAIEEQPKRKKREKVDKDKPKDEKGDLKDKGVDGQDMADMPMTNATFAVDTTELSPPVGASQDLSSTLPIAATSPKAGPDETPRPPAAQHPKSSHEKAMSGLAMPAAAQSMSISPTPPPLAGGLAAPTAAPSPKPTQGSLMAPPGMSMAPETKTSGVLAAPSLVPPPEVNGTGISSVHPPSKSNILAPPNTISTIQTPLVAPPGTPTATATCASPVDTHKLPKDAPTTPQVLAKPTTALSTEEATAPDPPSPPRNTSMTQNAIIYQNFNENAIKDKTVQTQILFGRKMSKLPKPQPTPICVITNHPAKYRDPATGLPYFNAQAYREIQRLAKGDYKWSNVLGAWVGTGTSAARGVPGRFLDPNVKREPSVKKEASATAESKDSPAAAAAQVEDAASKPPAPVEPNKSKSPPMTSVPAPQ